MTITALLEKLSSFVYGALIFMILAGVLFGVYHIFWSEEMTIPQQNDSVLLELKELDINSCFDVILRPHNKEYSLFLYPYGNHIDKCAERACLCLYEQGDLSKQEILYFAQPYCRIGPCVPLRGDSVRVPESTNKAVQICNNNNELSIKLV